MQSDLNLVKAVGLANSRCQALGKALQPCMHSAADAGSAEHIIDKSCGIYFDLLIVIVM